MTETARKLPVKIRKINLTAEFADWWFEARMNPPLGVFFDVASGDLERIAKGIARIIVAWNFVDEAGQALPDPTYEVFVANVTSDLLNNMASAWLEEMSKVPPA